MRPYANPMALSPMSTRLAILSLFAASAAADLPIVVAVDVPGGTTIAMPAGGPAALLVPFEVRMAFEEGALYAGIGLTAAAFEVRPVVGGDGGFESVGDGRFRVENLSPIRIDLAPDQERRVRFQVAIPPDAPPGRRHFRAMVHGDGKRQGVVFALDIVRGAPDVDLVCAEIVRIEEDGTPSSGPHALRFDLKIHNRGRHTWASRATVRVVVEGEGEERVEREVRLGLAPGRTSLVVRLEVEVLMPRTIEVVVDSGGDLPESDETNNGLSVEVPGQ